MKKFIGLVFLLAAVLSAEEIMQQMKEPVRSDKVFMLDEIVVTGTRVEKTLRESPGSLELVEGAKLADGVAKNAGEALPSLPGVDLGRNGTLGQTQNLLVRGVSSEGTLILLDGVPLNGSYSGLVDFSTLPLDNLERIEILKGPASSLYGANAFGGVINVITKKPADEAIILYAEGGSYDYFNGGLSVSLPVGPIKNRFSFSESRSTGYMPDTNFDIFSLANYSSVKTILGVYDFLFGYTKKDYGASNFYSNLYPNEAEETDTRFFNIGGLTEAGDLEVRPSLFLRRHWDKFRLDRNRPGWQTNYSTVYSS
ncbi:MAG: TonB-dependent receptor plug domain-containing protein [Candidatus Firestonebacteria bacterium]